MRKLKEKFDKDRHDESMEKGELFVDHWWTPERVTVPRDIPAT